MCVDFDTLRIAPELHQPLSPDDLDRPLPASGGPARPPARRGAIVRGVSVALVGAAIFSGGYLLHAGVNWPDFRQGDGLSKAQRLQLKVTPRDGVTVDARWGDLLPQLVAAGVIDVEKFSAAAERSGHVLTDGQMRLLTDGGDEAIHIDSHSSKFVLNALWAVGLAARSPLLTDGAMDRSGVDAARLASTAGWTLGAQPGPGYLATLDLLPHTPEQHDVFEEVAYGVYRPCCNNPTALPDCNHGMAALGLVGIMAYQGASADEIYRALSAVNAYWFPEQYLTLAMYYDLRGKAWDKVDPRELLDREHSGGDGWRKIDATVRQEAPFIAPKGGGGCSA